VSAAVCQHVPRAALQQWQRIREIQRRTRGELSDQDVATVRAEMVDLGRLVGFDADLDMFINTSVAPPQGPALAKGGGL
jgi:hypothetical protein